MSLTLMMLGGAAASGLLSAASRGMENQKARSRAKRDANLANRGIDLQVRQATDSYGHANQNIARGHEQNNFSWGQAQQQYDLQMSGLNHQTNRANEAVGRQNMENQAALGAFGQRGGSARTRADGSISDAREDISLSHDIQSTQLGMGREAAEKGHGWQSDTLNQASTQASQQFGYAKTSAALGREGIANEVNDVYSSTNFSSVLTAGLQGAIGGAQTGASLHGFGQKYGGQIKQDWGNFKSKVGGLKSNFGGNRAGAGGGSFNFSDVGNWGSW